MWMHRRHRLNWAAFPLTGAFETSDGAVVLVDAFKENPLRDICAALGVPDLSLDPRYATLEGQFEHKADLQALLRKSFKTNTTAYWIGRLEEQDLLCAPVLSLEEALDHEQTRVNGTIVEDSAVMPGRFIGSPVTMAEGTFRMRYDAPHHGEHTQAVLREIGYDEAKIAALRSARIAS